MEQAIGHIQVSLSGLAFFVRDPFAIPHDLAGYGDL